MRALVFGALLGLFLVVFGVPVVAVLDVLAAAVQPVTVAFALGLAARPYLHRPGRWTA